MVKIEFTGSADEVLAEMRLLAFVEPLVPLPEVIKAVAAPEPEPERESELPGLEEAAPPLLTPELAPARKRRTKEEMAAARAAEAAAAGAAHEVPAPVVDSMAAALAVADADASRDAAVEFTDGEPSKPLAFEDVKDALKELCEADGLGVEAAQKLLKQFGVSRLSLLDAARWGEFYESARHLVEPLV